MITDYGSLKSQIQKYLWNRKDLTDQIPSFISLCERKIFRGLRIPSMETLLKYEPASTEDGYAQLELPGDFLEVKFLLADNRPLERISDIEIQKKLFRASAPGEVSQFARIGNRLYLWRVSDNPETIFTMSYWRDFSNTLSADTDTHDILRVAPDLYLYGSCLEASPYLVDDSRIPVWQALYSESFRQLVEHYKEAEYAGSNVSVSAAAGGAYGDNSTYTRGYY